MSPLLFTSFILFIILNESPTSLSHHPADQQPPKNVCNENRCGTINIPFPFHLNASCASISPAFHLSCLNSTTLFLNIAREPYRVIQFFDDGLLVDFPGSTACREYNDLNSFAFTRNDYFSVSGDNVVGLYDCEDSSLCKAGCETNELPGCDRNDVGSLSLACCYPLSDHTVWDFGDEFSVFSRYGCRTLSSWVVSRGSNVGKRGVKLEWAVPRNKTSKGVCDVNANIVNATAVDKGVRCLCQHGFVGDGYANGVGCLKSCFKGGQEAYGEQCYKKRHTERKLLIVIGVLAPAFVLASLLALYYLLKRPFKPGEFDHGQTHFHSTISFRKACRTRLFTYQELEEATRGFEDNQKLVDGKNGVIHAGILPDGSHIAVQKLQCENERELIEVLSRIELLSSVLHRNLARLIGCCIDSGYNPFLVYEYPANGTLEEHLHRGKERKSILDWYKRLCISAETASVIAFLEYEISPPIFHCDLKSGYILLDEYFSVKIAGFGLLGSGDDGFKSYQVSKKKSDVYDFGLLLLEVITGLQQVDTPTIALQKIRKGKLEEIVDPSLYYHEQPPYRKEQIEIVADIATRCLLFGGDGKIGMVDVARELVHITKESIDGGSKRGPALEETFSNSSLLQMISTSPDSIHLP